MSKLVIYSIGLGIALLSNGQSGIGEEYKREMKKQNEN
jgi:hypothetical protein